MNFYKTTFFTSIYTAINLIASLVTVKVTAQLIGPEGTALIGQFTNTIAMLSLLATGAIGTGVVKYVAEYKNNPEQLKKYLSTAFGITLVCSGIIATFVLVFHAWLSQQAFKSHEFDSIFLLYGFFLVLNTFNLLLTQVLNGLSEVKKMTVVNIIGAVSNLILTIFLCLRFGVWGSLLALVIGQSVTFLALAVMLRRQTWWHRSYVFGGIDKAVRRQFLGFSFLTLLGLISPFTLMQIRFEIINTLGLEQAGCWQGILKISDTYMNFVTTILTVYYLPRMTEIKDNEHLVIREVRKGFKRIMPVMLRVSLGIWWLRDWIIYLLYTPKFLPMADLFAFQMIGNCLKIAGWLLMTLLLVSDRIKILTICWVTYELVYWVSSLLFIRRFGLVGVSYSYALTFLVYFSMAIAIFLPLMVQVKKSIFPTSVRTYVQQYRWKK